MPEPLEALRQVFATTFRRVFPSTTMSEWDPLTRVIGEWVCHLAPTPTELGVGSVEWELLSSVKSEGTTHLVSCKTVHHHGVTYRPQNGTTNIDSYVEVLLPGRGYFAARIESIFIQSSSPNDTVQAVVSLFKPLNRDITCFEPYRSLPNLGAQLVHCDLLPEKALVSFVQILGPVVICPFNSPHPKLLNTMVVVSASRKSK